ncbi:MAG: ABC transporter-related protein [uncultured bacterium]|nr:MAG: ABC transporter-related protein [uncultured bacterium]
MEKDIAISVKNVSKTFKIPHEKVSSLRGAAVSVFSRNKGFEEFKALDDVSFEVKKGEFFGIIGRNGSGKSTLLKILAGIYQVDKGSVEIDGMISPFLELGIGFNPELSGRDNVYLNATVLGMTKKEIDKKFDSIVQFSELERFIDQKLKNYSSGMQVRLAFSVSIHANREILLMDEVLAVGDSNFQRKCLGEFEKYKSQGKTVILVSHDIEVVRKYCNRVLLLDNGHVNFISDAEDAAFHYGKSNFEYLKKTAIDSKKDKKDKRQINSHKKTNYFENICIKNVNNNKTQIFNCSETIVIDIFIDVNEVDPEMGVGLGIYEKESGCRIAGFNTFFEKIKNDWKLGKNIRKLELQGDFFNQGEFFILVSIFNGDPVLNSYYDFFDSRKSEIFFNVLSNHEKSPGVANIDHSWK